MNMKYRQHKEKSSNYLEVTIYNKTKEIEERIATGKASKKELIKYKNVLRIEIKVKNGKLNSNKSQDQLKEKKNVRNKSLETYYNFKALDTYYSNTAKKIFGTEIYYRIDVAIKKINTSETLSIAMKEKLCTLIMLINSEGYTDAKQIWINTFSISTFNNHIKKIRSLGINEITFNEKINNEKIPYETIPNFSLIDNSEIEFRTKRKYNF